MGSCGTKIQKEVLPSTTCCMSPARTPPTHIVDVIHYSDNYNNVVQTYQEPQEQQQEQEQEKEQEEEQQQPPKPMSIFNINNDYINCNNKDNNNNNDILDVFRINSVESSPPLSPFTPLADQQQPHHHKFNNYLDICDDPGLLSGSSTGSTSSFGFESLRETVISQYKQSTKTEITDNVTMTQTSTIKNLYDQSYNIQNEPLIDLRFNRTLFCEDITYEYQVQCNLNQIKPQWILRLTVENITKFYGETLQKWREKERNNNLSEKDVEIPCQFGKVMTPKVFTSLIDHVLMEPALLKDSKYGQTTANFLNIPYDIRSIVEYNPDSYIYSNINQTSTTTTTTKNINQFNTNSFKFYDIICENDEKYKYLCHSQSVYKHDYEYDDCCQCYDIPQITCYSYWIRSLQHNKIDFLINCTSNNVFTIIMSDLSFNIAQVLINNIGIDENSAWIITDFLPKYLLFDHQDLRCNAQIIYKYDQRDCIQSDCDEYFEILPEMNMNNKIMINSADNILQTQSEDYGEFFVSDNNDILKRHNVNIKDLYSFCRSMCIQHTTIPCIAEMSPSVSEYIESISRSTINIMTLRSTTNLRLSDEAYSGHDQTRESLQYNNNQYDGAHHHHHHENDTENEENEEKFRVFFCAFIDEEGEDDVNMCQWLTSLKKLRINLTEKQIVDAFKFMLRQNEEDSCDGYIDYVDFTNFCQLQLNGNDEVKRTQQQINHFIARNRS